MEAREELVLEVLARDIDERPDVPRPVDAQFVGVFEPWSQASKSILISRCHSKPAARASTERRAWLLW